MYAHPHPRHSTHTLKILLSLASVVGGVFGTALASVSTTDAQRGLITFGSVIAAVATAYIAYRSKALKTVRGDMQALEESRNHWKSLAEEEREHNKNAAAEIKQLTKDVEKLKAQTDIAPLLQWMTTHEMSAESRARTQRDTLQSIADSLVATNLILTALAKKVDDPPK